MPNAIDAHLEFSYRGETHTLSATLDLDRILAKYGEVPSLHHVLAMEHGIDTYSYQFEVMLEEEIRYSRPQGQALAFFDHGQFDLAGYIAQHANHELLDALQAIAVQELGIENLDMHPEIKQALLRAYRLGVEA